ncbi:MAG: anthranilate synthase component I, partial [Propionibacteriales bacterium]|nr:anthranilate synthase component I [Propionibacteriales bacterium]
MTDRTLDISPTLDEFRAAAAIRRVVSVYRRLLVDTETVVGLTARLTRHRPGTFCFESAERAGVWSRWSFIGVNCAATLSERDGRAHWTGNVPSGLPTDGDPLQVLGEVL